MTVGNHTNIGDINNIIIEPEVCDRISFLRTNIQSLLAELPNVQTSVEISLTSHLLDNGRWETKVFFGNASDRDHLETRANTRYLEFLTSTRADYAVHGLLLTEQFAVQRYIDSVWRDLAPTLRHLVHSLGDRDIMWECSKGLLGWPHLGNAWEHQKKRKDVAPVIGYLRMFHRLSQTDSSFSAERKRLILVANAIVQDWTGANQAQPGYVYTCNGKEDIERTIEYLSFPTHRYSTAVRALKAIARALSLIEEHLAGTLYMPDDGSGDRDGLSDVELGWDGGISDVTNACTRAIEKSMQILREVPKGYVHLGRVLYDTMLIVGDPNDLERELATHRLFETDRRQMGPQVTGPPTGLIHSLIERIHESTRTCEWDANVHAGGPFPFERT